MPFFVKSYDESENFIRLATREVWVNTFRAFALVLGILALPGLAIPVIGGLFIVLSAVFALIAQYMLTVTVIDKNEMTIKQKGKVLPFSGVDCIATHGYVRKFKNQHATQYVPYFVLSVVPKAGNTNKTFINASKDYVAAIKQEQSGQITKENFEKAEQSFFDDFTSKMEHSIVIIDSPNEHKTWQTSEKIAKFINVPIVDMVGGVLIREERLLDMPYAEFLQQDFLQTGYADIEECKMSHKVNDGKLTIMLGESKIEVDKDNISMDLKKKWFDSLRFKGNKNPLPLKSIESMRHTIETDKPYISFIGDDDYSQIFFNERINCFFVHMRIRHFLAAELKKIEVSLSEAKMIQVSCDVLFRGIASNVMKLQSVEEIKAALTQFLNNHDKSISLKELEEGAFNEIESRLLKAGYINAEKDDKGVARWSITELGSSIALP